MYQRINKSLTEASREATGVINCSDIRDTETMPLIVGIYITLFQGRG